MWSPWPIIGYRVWTLRHQGIYGGAAFRWEQASLVAECRIPKRLRRPGAPHTLEDEVCAGRCGINAYADPFDVVADSRLAPIRLPGERTADARARANRLYGVVSLSGKVIEHSDGYRAERAVVRGLVFPDDGVVRTTTDPGAIRATFAARPHRWLGWDAVTPESAEAVPETVISELRSIGHAIG
jgi:hypothetical protein